MDLRETDRGWHAGEGLWQVGAKKRGSRQGEESAKEEGDFVGC